MKTKIFPGQKRLSALCVFKTIGGWRRTFGKHGSWRMPLLCLVLGLELSELRLGTPTLQGMKTSPGEEIPELDSFAQPDLALSVLKHHAQNLFFAYTVGETSTNHGWPPGEGPLAAPSWRGERREGGDDSARLPLCALRPGIRDLYEDLLVKLLAVHYQKQSWNEFLDCYLELLAVAPGNLGLVTWTRSALACSASCGRTNELLDALNHFTRFSPNPRVAARCQDMLDQWKHGRIPTLANDQPFQESYSLCVAANPFARPMLEEH